MGQSGNRFVPGSLKSAVIAGRAMPNLKLIGLRLKSVTNIQKITQSMKMVSAAKFARAEKDLKAARPLGTAAQAFYEQAEVATDKEAPKELYVAMTSDRGLAKEPCTAASTRRSGRTCTTRWQLGMISAILKSSVWGTSPELSSKDFSPPS